MKINGLIHLLHILQNDVEPLPEPFRTIFFYLVLFGGVIIPICACLFGWARRNAAKRRVEELGVSWKEMDAKLPKTEDALIDNLFCIVVVILVIFVGIVVVLMQILGPFVRDIAVVVLVAFAILFIVACCPIAMIWGVRVDERRNSERIRMAEEYERLKETGGTVSEDPFKD
ncbi:MAG: hypothetical protein ACFFE2_10855 [Candidatus Thorarchaeota archaeon]